MISNCVVRSSINISNNISHNYYLAIDKTPKDKYTGGNNSFETVESKIKRIGNLNRMDVRWSIGKLTMIKLTSLTLGHL
jgi:hypothetical protein